MIHYRRVRFPAPATVRDRIRARWLAITGAGSAEPANAWERWLPVWHVALYVLLALATCAALLDEQTSWLGRGAAVGLALLLGGWYWAIVVARPAWGQRSGAMLAYFVGAWLLFAALTAVHPAYMLLAFVLYLQLYSFLPLRWAIPGSIALTVLLWWRNSDLLGEPVRPTVVTLVIAVVAFAMSTTLSLFIDAIIRQSHERQRLVEELRAARDEVAAAERQAGVHAERQRLAGEIHDTLAQGFASIVMHLEAAESHLPAGAEPAARHLDQARRTAREGLTEARRMVWALRPAPLEQASLPDALERLAGRWSEENGATARAVVTGTARPLHPEVEVTLLRAAQEALANVRQHARAEQVTLTLSYMDDLTVLDVQDDGVGFDPREINGAARSGNGGGFGLEAMRARVEALGGTLAIESAPGHGASIAAAVPALGVPAHGRSESAETGGGG